MRIGQSQQDWSDQCPQRGAVRFRLLMAANGTDCLTEIGQHIPVEIGICRQATNLGRRVVDRFPTDSTFTVNMPYASGKLESRLLQFTNPNGKSPADDAMLSFRPSKGCIDGKILENRVAMKIAKTA